MYCMYVVYMYCKYECLYVSLDNPTVYVVYVCTYVCPLQVYVCVYIAACAQTVALPFGIYSGRQKSRLLLACYITVVVLIILVLILCCVLGWIAAFYKWNPSR